MKGRISHTANRVRLKQSSHTKKMEQQPIRISIGYNKNLTVKKNGQYTNAYVNDNFFENGQLVQDKSKSVWLKWEEALRLRDAINTAEEQLICLEVSFLRYIFKTFFVLKYINKKIKNCLITRLLMFIFDLLEKLRFFLFFHFFFMINYSYTMTHFIYRLRQLQDFDAESSTHATTETTGNSSGVKRKQNNQKQTAAKASKTTNKFNTPKQ